ncbi:redoxin domain-containing protein [Methylovirgula sp. 4M-Z18]|uniref:redoxin domain-containing protein n=1 Tax=Methylovirgula sp. 4M-Z18 TaxID=2293567 RepID=UPI000E2E66F3|nr:redoxin domain-containing protein [Methylovirgula sp. 4M-Z18]RFB79792.1 alkyl hydroperoxide reductase [Methylovirgula sp. 4M-Z18]
MTMTPMQVPIALGERAPDFSLPTLDGAGSVSLSDYRGKSSLFLALFVGLWCPFCRRAIAQMGAAGPQLQAMGVETLGIVATELENARLYFKFRPSRLRIATDPELFTHRAYGVPRPVPTQDLIAALAEIRVNPTGDLPEPLPVSQAAAAQAKLDGYIENQTDHADMERQWPQLKGQFLIDRDGLVRWTHIECSEGLEGIGKFPSTQEIVDAVKASIGRQEGRLH